MTGRRALGAAALAAVLLAALAAHAQPSSTTLLNIVVEDLCGRPVTSLDDPSAYLILTFTSPNGTKVSVAAGLGRNGTTLIVLEVPGLVPGTDHQLVPGSRVDVSLVFKRVRLDPVSGPGTLVISGETRFINARYTFPVGDLALRATLADAKEPVANASVTLDLVKQGAVVHSEGPRLTGSDGVAVFTKIPLVLEPAAQGVVTVKTSRYTPLTRHPEDEGIVIARLNLSDLLGAAGTPPSCTTGPIDLPTTLLSVGRSLELLRSLELENAQLREQLAKLQASAAELEKAASSLASENTQLRSQLEELRARLSQLQEEARSLQAEKAEIAQQLQAAQARENHYKLATATLLAATTALAALLAKRTRAAQPKRSSTGKAPPPSKPREQPS